MEQEKQETRNTQGPEQIKVEGGTYSREIKPPLEPHCDDRARAGHSGEGDRTDTEEMHRLAD